MKCTLTIAALISSIFFIGCGTYAQTKPAISDADKYKLAAEYSRQFRGLSVLVIKGDKVVFEEYQNGHSADTPWMLASGTKSFNGVMLAAAIEDKLVKNFDEKVSDTITEWKPDPRRSKITLRQLLSLTSGLEAGAIGRPPSYSSAVQSSVRFDAGEKFEYGPAAFQVFGEVMRRKLAPKNEGVLEYLKRRILDRIGLNVASWALQNGQPNLPSGAFLTAREWAKFGMLLKNGGKWNGKQIVGKKLLDELVIGSKANPNYGITFWLNHSNDGKADVAETPSRFQALQDLLGIEPETTEISKNGVGADVAKDLYMAAGAGKQRLYIIPSLDIVIVRQGRQSRFDDREFLTRLLSGKGSN